jgi:hypothetical protein
MITVRRAAALRGTHHPLHEDERFVGYTALPAQLDDLRHRLLLGLLRVGTIRRLDWTHTHTLMSYMYSDPPRYDAGAGVGAVARHGGQGRKGEGRDARW